MISLWIAASVILAISVLYITKPLFTKMPSPEKYCASDSDVAYFKDQLCALDSDVKNNRITQRQYTLLYAQTARALLRAGEEATETPSTAKKSVQKSSIIIIWVFFPILIFGTYLYVGNSTFPDIPIKLRRAEIAKMQAEQQQTVAINAMVKKLERRLTTTDKKDVEGWKMLARSYTILGNRKKQLFAYDSWARLEPKNPLPLLMQARVLRSISRNKQTEKSFSLMERVLEIDSHNLEALILSSLYLYKHKKLSIDDALIQQRLQKALSLFKKDSAKYKNLQKTIKKLFK